MSRTITRRDFLKKSLAGASLTIAVTVTPFGTRLFSAEEMEKESAFFGPNAWLRITPDNMVDVFVNKSEMGQGVYTSLPMIIADELDADWKQVRLKIAPAEDKYKDPVWGAQATGGSSSVRHMYEPLRKAGAAGREMLIKAFAGMWHVPEDECETLHGAVRHIVTKQSMTFGQLAIKASKLPVPQNPSLKKENQLNIIGASMPRLDIHDKTNGTAGFGIDSFLEGMLYAAVARPHAYGAKPVSYDEEAAMKIPGVRHVVQIKNSIAVCADALDSAWKGRSALNVKWDTGTDPELNNEKLEKSFIEDLNKKGLVARNDGSANAALETAAKKVEAVYLLPYLSHATMEPMNCFASVGKNRCEIWVPTQNQTGVLKLAEKETGLKPDDIQVHTTYLGGGFGRRYETDVVEEAVKISKVVEKPIKLLWTREEDMTSDFYRPGNCSKITGGIDEKGNLIAWSHKIVCPSIFARAMANMVKDGIDPAAVEGLKNMEYEVPNIYIEYVRKDTPVPVGFWRSVGSTHNAFTVENFMDEMAHTAKKDPLEFRLNLLKNHRRAYRVLEVVAEKAGWGKPPAKGMGRGIAQHFSFESYVAQVTDVSVDKKDGTIKVHRVICAVDCGPVINPLNVIYQTQGGIIMGLSAALKECIEFAGGGAETSNFDKYPLLRMSEIPEIEVYIVKGSEKLGGVGEPGVPPIAPAVANAVFNAAGIRLRNLPMKPETVLDAIKKA